MSGKWFFVLDGERQGPVSQPDMADLLLDGDIIGSTLVWTPGQDAWLELSASALSPLLDSIPPEVPPALPDLELAKQSDASTRSIVSDPYADDTLSPASTAPENGSLQGTPLKGLYQWVRPALLLYIGSQALVAASAFATIVFLDDIQNRNVIGDQAISQGNAVDLFYGGSNLAMFLLLLSSGFLFMRFVFRAMKNLHLSQAAGVTISPGWAVGYYFVPILTLWKPLQAMRQIWRGSHDPENANAKVPAAMGWWWAFFIATNILAQVSMAVQPSTVPGEFNDQYFEQTTVALQTDIVAQVLGIISVMCLLYLLKRIKEAQDQRLRFDVSEEFT